MIVGDQHQLNHGVDMKIAIDFDGTCVEHVFPEIGRPAPGAVAALQALSNKHELFLFTMRSGEYLKEAVEWFSINEIPLAGIQCDPQQHEWTDSPKCYAQIYIDDAAYGVPLIQPEGFERPCVDWSKVII